MSEDEVKLLTAELWDGRKVAYHSKTEFLIQIGRGKGSYKTKYRIVGNFGQAWLIYGGMNIRYPFKKRLFMPSSPNGTITREIGY